MVLAFALLFTGCPEPIDQEPGGNGDGDGLSSQEEAIKQASNSMPTDINGEMDRGLAVAPPTMGTFPGDLAESEVKPVYTQEELKDAAVIHGYVKCEDCSGSILIRALPPPPGTEGADEEELGMQLITQKTLSKAGSFEFRVPDKKSIVLQVVDDINGDGIPSQGERMGMRGSGPLYVEGVTEGIELTVGVFPQKEPDTMGVLPTPPVPVEGADVQPPAGPAGGLPPEGGAGGFPADGAAPGEAGAVQGGDQPPAAGAEQQAPPSGPPGDDGEAP